MSTVLDLTRAGGYTLSLLPEIVLCAGAMLVLIVDVVQKGNRSEPSRAIRSAVRVTQPTVVTTQISFRVPTLPLRRR